MSLYNVFDSLEVAEIAQAQDFELFKIKNGYTPESEYWKNTTCWDEVKQRSDGKYVYQAMSDGIVHNQEVYDEEWFDCEDV